MIHLEEAVATRSIRTHGYGKLEDRRIREKALAIADESGWLAWDMGW